MSRPRLVSHPRLVWRSAAPLAAGACALVAVPAVLLDGLPGLVGALLGLALVVLFFGPDILLAAVARGRLDPVGLAMVGYVVKLIVIGGLLFAVEGTDAVSAPALVAGVAAGTAGWLTGHVRAVGALGRLPVSGQPPARVVTPADGPAPADDVVEGA